MNKIHYNVSRCYERDLLLYLRTDHSRKINKTMSGVVKEDEKGVSQEKHLWDVDATDGTTVKCTLKPLAGKRNLRSSLILLASKGVSVPIFIH